MRLRRVFAVTTVCIDGFLFGSSHYATRRAKIIRWYGTSTDIEELKQTEEKLRDDERELRRITDAIPQAIVVLDPAASRSMPTKRHSITRV